MLAESCSLPWRLEALLVLWHRCCSEAGSTDGRSTDELGSQGQFAREGAGKTRFISLGGLSIDTILYDPGRPDYFRFFLPGAAGFAGAASARAASRFKRLRLKLSAMSFDARASRSIGDRFFSSQKRRRHPTGSSRNALTAPETPSFIIWTTASLRSGDHDAIV